MIAAMAIAPHESQAYECGRGTICQGSGCSKAENNPTDNLNFNLTANETVSILVTRSPNDPIEATGQCALSFNRSPGSANGLFTSGLTTNNVSSGQTDALDANETRTVVYTAGATGPFGATINLGPPTSSAEQNCDNPAQRKAFTYVATCSAPPPAVTLKLEKRVSPESDPGKFNLSIKDGSGRQRARAPEVQNGRYTANPAATQYDT